MSTLPQSSINALRASWAMLAAQPERLSLDFYDRLIRRDARLQQMFNKTDMVQQRAKLVQTLQALIDSLDDLPTIVPTLRQLGAAHARYGVRARDYDTIGAALLATFDALLGSRFTAEMRGAWTIAYALVAGIMRDAGTAVLDAQAKGQQA